MNSSAGRTGLTSFYSVRLIFQGPSHREEGPAAIQGSNTEGAAHRRALPDCGWLVDAWQDWLGGRGSDLSCRLRSKELFRRATGVGGVFFRAKSLERMNPPTSSREDANQHPRGHRGSFLAGGRMIDGSSVLVVSIGVF